MPGAANLIHNLGGIVSVHAGTKTNSIEEISNAEKFKQALKENLLKKYIDILEVGKEGQVADYRENVFPGIKHESPIIACSDNHNVNEYALRAPCWIKANPTFLGLKQVLLEPMERVFLGDAPPILERVKKNKTKYIDRIEIRKNEDSDLNEKWFDAEILLNYGLIAIIGKKGSGKSALADAFGFLGDSKSEKDFSFLNTEKFRNPKNNLAAQFNARLDWADGRFAQKQLSESIDPARAESVLYLPQKYFETICNELSMHGKGQFHDELEAVIFSHVSEADRLGMDSLDSLINFRTQEREKRINQLKGELSSVNELIINFERENSKESQARLASEIERKQDELKAHQSTCPKEVLAPNGGSPETGQIKAERQLAEISAELKSLEEKITDASENIKDVTTKIAQIQNVLFKISNFEKTYSEFKGGIESDLKVVGIEIAIAEFEINKELIHSHLKRMSEQQVGLGRELSKESTDSYYGKQRHLQKNLEEHKKKLDEPQKIFYAYLKARDEWEKREKTIIGNSTEIGSWEYFIHKQKESSDAPRKLSELRACQ